MSQANEVFKKVMNGTKIPLQGAYLGRQRLSEEKMRILTSTFNIEFGQVYTVGKKRNGRGGYYTLYSGTLNTLTIPANANEYFINHTHPMGTEKPSIFDIECLINIEAAGSLQRSSVIFPIGHPAFRFNQNSPYNQ